MTLALSSCATESPERRVQSSSSAPDVLAHRAIARKALTLRLDWTVRAAGLRKEVGRGGLDRCRKGDDDPKNAEGVTAKCTLTLHRAYLWNGDITAFLNRFDRCPAASEIRGYWREFGGRPDPRERLRTYDVGDLPELMCDGVRIEFATSRMKADRDLTTMPGATVFDEGGGMYEPYHWAPEGRPWLSRWLKIRRKARYLVAMQVSEEYSVLGGRQ
ncbi:hypothetical protein [Nonomuraea lactucae]|uniref:hypothetical protein n=1 Tax=Nonomuraea lactucae TaxID=2249762 RepID=UPI0013B3E09F|nr:hypothetical protein [Nonomuraea lactucae]